MSGIWDMTRKNPGILEQNVNNLFQNEKKEKKEKKTKKTKRKACYTTIAQQEVHHRKQCRPRRCFFVAQMLCRHQLRLSLRGASAARDVAISGNRFVEPTNIVRQETSLRLPRRAASLCPPRNDSVVISAYSRGGLGAAQPYTSI